MTVANTHYAVVVFGGDPGAEHPDEELRGRGPHLELIACGSESFCWEHVSVWVGNHPLQDWQTVEVLMRDPAVVRVPKRSPDTRT